MNTKFEWQTWHYIVIAIVVILGILFMVVPMTYNNSAADAELMVNKVKDNCIETYDKGISTILDVAHVDKTTKDFLLDLVQSPSPTKDGQAVKESYNEMLNGNPASFMLLVGAMGKTDFTVTSQNLQREIVSQRSEMLTCAKLLNLVQTELKMLLGRDASGRVVKFPQKFLNLAYPSEIFDETLTDTDHDGKLTVLDYKPPVSIETANPFGSGEGLPVIELP